MKCPGLQQTICRFFRFSQTRDRNATRVTDGAVSGGIEEYRGGRLSCVKFDAFAVPRGQRVRRFEQCLEVVKRLWTEDNVSFENDICKLTNVTMTCRPISSHIRRSGSPPTTTGQ
jgi:hypothetical protein